MASVVFFGISLKFKDIQGKLCWHREPIWTVKERNIDWPAQIEKIQTSYEQNEGLSHICSHIGSSVGSYISTHVISDINTDITSTLSTQIGANITIGVDNFHNGIKLGLGATIE